MSNNALRYTKKHQYRVVPTELHVLQYAVQYKHTGLLGLFDDWEILGSYRTIEEAYRDVCKLEGLLEDFLEDRRKA